MKRLIPVLLIIVVAFITYKFFNKNNSPLSGNTNVKPDFAMRIDSNLNTFRSSSDINTLTSENVVVSYVKQHHHLPGYYLTKSEARKKGWNPSQGNLCDVLPGHAIGGDRFSNREHSLPDAAGRKWFEADINFDCGRRNADRLLYSSDGLVFVTKDHYKTFEQK